MPEDDKKPEAGRIERRFTSQPVSNVRLEKREDGPPKIAGVAAVYYDGTPETEYELAPGIRERIRPGAFAKSLKAKPDVMCLSNHEPDNVLGRTPETLKLKSTKRGLEYVNIPPDTQLGHDVPVLLERGDVTGSSFAFTLGPDDFKWTEEDGAEIRTLTGFKELWDVGPVTYPAYAATDAHVASLRSLGAEYELSPRQRAAAEDDALYDAHKANDCIVRAAHKKAMDDEE